MQEKRISILETILSLSALTIAILIFSKAIIDIDTNYDVGWYHLPFAARIWGIIPIESFVAEAKIEDRYDGFPLLAHFFQGLLWKLTGRVQATNLVGYFSLVIYFFFLRNYFQVPLYLSTIAIFTIPAVLTHAATSFVDLPGNIGAATVMMMSYRFFSSSRLPNKKELLAAFLGAAMAVNTKPQLQPLIFVLYWVSGIRLIWLYFRHTAVGKRHLWLTIPLTAIASSLIFATPIKNVALYGNPFYPTKVEVAGIVLNHRATPQAYGDNNRPQKWLMSILEINTPEWSADQLNRNGNKKLLDRAGGFFGAYVAFNLILLVSLTVREHLLNRASVANKTRNASTALSGILLVSLIPANFPQSHELRYFMFWMITLVSLNLCIIFSLLDKNKWIRAQYIGLVYLPFFIAMCIKIESFYLKPDFRTLEVYLDRTINTEFLEQISPKENNCVISRYEYNSTESIPLQHVFYYSSYFHPELGANYSITVQENAKQCKTSKVIPRSKN